MDLSSLQHVRTCKPVRVWCDVHQSYTAKIIFATCVHHLRHFLPNKQEVKATAKVEDLEAAMAAAGLEFGVSVPTAPPGASSPGAAHRNPRAPLGDISNLAAEGVGRAAGMDGGGADATLERGKIGESGTGMSGRPFGKGPDGSGRGTGGAGRGSGGGGSIGGRGGSASPLRTGSPEAGMKGPASGPASGPAKTRGPVPRTATGTQGGGSGSGDASPPAASAARHGFSGSAAREDSKRSGGDGGHRMPNRGSREGGGATGSSIDLGEVGAVGQRGDGVGAGTRNTASGGDGQQIKREGGGGKVGWGGGGRKRGPWSAQKRSAGAVEGRGENEKPVVIDPRASVDEIISSMGLNRDITLQGLGVGSENLGLPPGDRSKNPNSGGKDGTVEEGQKGWGIGRGLQRLFRGKTKGQAGEK